MSTATKSRNSKLIASTAIAPKLTVKAAVATAGSVSKGNSKMPGSTFAIDAKQCGVGSKLAKVEGSTCSKCYALKIQAMRPSVNQGWESNYLKATRLISENPAQWARAMAFQIERIAANTGERFHRWFDGGDLASVEMLRAIVLTCEATPTIQHWLPTREAAMVKAYRKAFGPLPSNLALRVSATMIGDKPVSGHENTSTVHRKGATIHGHGCPANSAEHRALHAEGKANCGPCRACWNPAVANVSYPLH